MSYFTVPSEGKEINLSQHIVEKILKHQFMVKSEGHYDN
jgi:hypothetical protein